MTQNICSYQYNFVSSHRDSKYYIMATTQLKLSSKVDANGRSQVIVKLTITRTNRPCFKSGVFVNPEWFKVIQETKKGSVYGIVVPKKGKLNLLDVKEAETQKAALDSYISKLTAVCNVLTASLDNVDHESIEEAMSLTRHLSAGAITYQTILDAKKQQEERSTVSNDRSFFGWMEYYISKSNVVEGRKRSFRVLARSLARYQSFVRLTDRQRKNFSLEIDTIDKQIIEDFFDYLSNERALSKEYPEIFGKLLSEYPVEFSPKHKTPEIAERGRNIILERMKYFRAFYHWLNDNGITDNRPFHNIKIEAGTYGTPYYLNLEERNTVADYEIGNKHLETQRDIFIFQCLVGCRYSDLQKLTEKSLVRQNGIVAIEYIPRKTKDKKPVIVSVPLNCRAMALVEKYKGLDRKGRLFPFISMQKYNEAVKEILTACGIRRIVPVINPTTGEAEQKPICEIASSHMARRTFIGNLYKKVKDPSLIGSMSGHVEGSRAFARYRDIDMDIKKDTVALID